MLFKAWSGALEMEFIATYINKPAWRREVVAVASAVLVLVNRAHCCERDEQCKFSNRNPAKRAEAAVRKPRVASAVRDHG